jgi:quercetin 2,3-dioxygenase
MSSSVVLNVARLGFPFRTLDPFLFCVYHKDQYPAGNEHMEAPRVGNGADFDFDAEYRMYHGDKIPGFPQHPHRGFETVTATMKGIIDHTDSLGSAGRYGGGDLQWVTAGKGIVHGEMFPLINKDSPNPTKFFQIWLNLPKVKKMADPTFIMHWAEEIPIVLSEDGSVKVVVWAGSIGGAKGLPPPPDSWASDPANELAVWHITAQPGGRYTIPPALGGRATNRAVYVTEGAHVEISGQRIASSSMAELRADLPADLHNSDKTTAVEILLLQGRPINEPVAQQGPFVMNTQDEIRQAYEDYRRTQFGGWPWKEDAVVFPREKGRFALFNGVETYPPKISAKDASNAQGGDEL